MKLRRAGGVLALLAIAGCEQTSQELPFGPGAGEEVSRTIGSEGGAISSAAGLSLQFASGSLTQPTEITVAHLPGADIGAPVEGTVLEGTVFEVDPSGLGLGVPAELSLQVPPTDVGSRDGLALTAVVVADAEWRYLSDASVDLQAGILRTDLPQLGTVGVRLSDDVIEIGSGGTLPSRSRSGLRSSSPATTAPLAQTFTMVCGDDGEPNCAITDAIEITLSDDLYDAINGCAEFIDPVIRVDLTLDDATSGGETGRAAGTVSFSGTLRYQTGSDGTTCGSGSGSVQSLAVDDSFSLGSEEDPWTPFTYDPVDGVILFQQTSDGIEVINCACGADIFAAEELWVGQTSEEITFEGLSGEVTWAIRLERQ